jgi:hypothetical protein
MLNDAQIRFSTFEEGCSWLSGHKQLKNIDVGSLYQRVSTILTDWQYEPIFLQDDLVIDYLMDDISLPRVERIFREAYNVILVLFRDVSWITLQMHGCLWARFPMRDQFPYKELCVNLEAGRNGTGPSWTGSNPHFLGISARV